MNKKICFIIFLCLVFIPYKTNAIQCYQPRIVPTESSYFFTFDFKKTDASATVEFPLKNAEFNITSLDNRYTFETTQSYNNTNDYYELKSLKIVNAEELYELLPQEIKNLYSSINSYNDYINIKSQIKYSNYDRCNEWYDENNNKYSDSSIEINFQIPIKIVETKSPIGYIKDEFVAITDVTLFFNYKNQNEAIDNKQIVITSTNNIFYQYDKTIDYNQYIVNNNLIELLQSYPSYEGYIPNKKGNVELEIDNKIENAYNYETNSKKIVNYVIKVSNKGNAPSGDNIVTIVIPKDLKVKEETISDNGILDLENNTVSWSIDYLESNSEKNLSFDIIIPNKTIGEYSFFSSINHNKTNINAPKTTLKINKEITDSKAINNPKTRAGISKIIIAIIFLAITISYLTFKRTKKDLLK